MKLYALIDVKRAAYLRHGSQEGIEAAKGKRAHRSQAIKATRTSKRDERRLELEQA